MLFQILPFLGFLPFFFSTPDLPVYSVTVSSSRNPP